MKIPSLCPFSVLFGFGLGGLLAFTPASYAGSPSEPARRFEYTLLVDVAPLGEWMGERAKEYGLGKTDDASIPVALRKYGSEGWELVTFERSRDNNQTFYFKRSVGEKADD